MIIRENYLNTLRKLQDVNLIKVLTGVRRVGKSTLLMSFREDLIKRGVKKAQIQSFNFEEEKNADLLDWRKLHQQIEQKLVPDANNYIFLDEIQNVPNFERCVDSLFIKENVDVYITGSNAFFLSGELATLLTGRYVSIHVLPFSFSEYVKCFPGSNLGELFSKYQYESSFPEAVNVSVHDSNLTSRYLDGLYDTIVIKDIATRYDIQNVDVFHKVVKFIMSSLGSPVSANSIANYLKSQHNPVHHNTITQYLKCLTDCFLLYPANRYDIRGKNILSSNEKYYVVDLGIRDHLLGNSPDLDRGHRLENTVYLELVRRYGNKVWVGKQGNQEVDFVVQKYDGGREYFQVAYELSSEETFKREIEPMRKINDNYPKTIITTEPFDEDFAGIKKVNIINWLLEKE